MREWIGVVHHNFSHRRAFAPARILGLTTGAAATWLGTQLSVSHLHLAFCRLASGPRGTRFLIGLQSGSNPTNRIRKEGVIGVTSAGAPSHHPRMTVELKLYPAPAKGQA